MPIQDAHLYARRGGWKTWPASQSKLTSTTLPNTVPTYYITNIRLSQENNFKDICILGAHPLLGS